MFCRIVAGDVAADVVAEDEHTMAFLPTGPATRGHTLVVPRNHADDIWDIGEADALAVMAMARRVAHLLGERLRPDGMNLTQSNRPAGRQEVPHFHLHVIPRWSDDGIAPPWPRTDPSDEDVASLLRQLRPPVVAPATRPARS